MGCCTPLCEGWLSRKIVTGDGYGLTKNWFSSSSFLCSWRRFSLRCFCFVILRGQHVGCDKFACWHTCSSGPPKTKLSFSSRAWKSFFKEKQVAGLMRNGHLGDAGNCELNFFHNTLSVFPSVQIQHGLHSTLEFLSAKTVQASTEVWGPTSQKFDQCFWTTGKEINWK